MRSRYCLNRFNTLYTSLNTSVILLQESRAQRLPALVAIQGFGYFAAKMYHDWVYAEALDEKFPPVLRSNAALDVEVAGKTIKAGIGLHDSSSALIPYLACFSEPFILLSTGTWCISLNPFNDTPLTTEELQQDCLCYLEYHGRPVKASRLFAGNEHEQQVKLLAAHFALPPDHYQKVSFVPALLDTIHQGNKTGFVETGLQSVCFSPKKPV